MFKKLPIPDDICDEVNRWAAREHFPTFTSAVVQLLRIAMRISPDISEGSYSPAKRGGIPPLPAEEMDWLIDCVENTRRNIAAKSGEDSAADNCDSKLSWLKEHRRRR